MPDGNWGCCGAYVTGCDELGQAHVLVPGLTCMYWSSKELKQSFTNQGSSARQGNEEQGLCIVHIS